MCAHAAVVVLIHWCALLTMREELAADRSARSLQGGGRDREVGPPAGRAARQEQLMGWHLANLEYGNGTKLGALGLGAASACCKQTPSCWWGG